MFSAFHMVGKGWIKPVETEKTLAISGQDYYLDQVKKLGCADETILKDVLLSMDDGYKTLTDIGKETVLSLLNS